MSSPPRLPQMRRREAAEAPELPARSTDVAEVELQPKPAKSLALVGIGCAFAAAIVGGALFLHSRAQSAGGVAPGQHISVQTTPVYAYRPRGNASAHQVAGPHKGAGPTAKITVQSAASATPQPSQTTSAASRTAQVARAQTGAKQNRFLQALHKAQKSIASALEGPPTDKGVGSFANASPPVREAARPPSSQTAATTQTAQPPAPTAAPTQAQVANADTAHEVDAQLIDQAQPLYPELAKQQGAQGTAVVLATIGLHGEVVSATIEHTAGNRLLDQAALSAARDSKFRAAEINGKPVVQVYRLVYHFSL